ncbi:MAG: DegT/DnrJ/EryC1/StrS aminotransferase family protein [Thermomicrobiales bacterium]
MSMAAVTPRWEVGSGFEWRDDTCDDPNAATLLPPGHVLFSSGSGALLALVRHHGGRSARPVLHLPSFFCMKVAARLRAAFDLAWYQDEPAAPQPHFDSLRPAPGDWVLAVNLFGIRTGKAWTEWLAGRDEIILVEDHTHDPFSPWAGRSATHYALASLRKTLPLPDGALLWSPRQLPVPAPSSPPPAAAHDHLAAMVLKGAYLRGAGVARDEYRALYLRADHALATATDSTASDFTRNVLGRLPVSRFRQQRASNVRHLVQLLSGQPIAGWEPLFTTWPDETVPFNGVLRCRSTSVRDRLRQYLIERDVFCPIHWEQTTGEVVSDDPLARDLSQRVLTVPVDQRYGRADVARIVEIIADFARGRNAVW